MEANKQLHQPQEAEIAVTTPTTASFEKQESRSASPSKGRVRDLIEKIDSAGNSRRGSQASLSDLEGQSFRPKVPGAWSSYTTNTGPRSGNATPELDPFAKAAAAGSALAGALASAVGMKTEEPTAVDTKEEELRRPNQNLAIHPEASRLELPRNDSDAPSSIMPTPMDMKPESEQYFPPVTPLNQKSRPQDLPRIQQTRIEDMSTESSPNDLESDRLRKELVRELSPQAESFPTEAPAKTHESMFGLPSEYESYWSDNNPEPSYEQLNQAQPSQEYPIPESDRELERKFSWETPVQDLGSNTSTPGPSQSSAPQDSNHQRVASQPINVNKELPDPVPRLSEEERPQRNMPHEPPANLSDVTLPAPQQKIPAFLEILQLMSPDERIKAYNATREVFANMNTGLSQWIQTTTTALPEHQDLLRNGGTFGIVPRPTPRPTQAQAPLKSPFSPPAGKVATQKGKDLLHSAGIFGGKANNAAKGFFAKGKSRFRGGDKVD